uniref:Uncharacterized protein n=1 Tax=Oryza punctata TaxID=4537 RepID=A0A0E0L394_ORYPU
MAKERISLERVIHDMEHKLLSKILTIQQELIEIKMHDTLATRVCNLEAVADIVGIPLAINFLLHNVNGGWLYDTIKRTHVYTELGGALEITDGGARNSHELMVVDNTPRRKGSPSTFASTTSTSKPTDAWNGSGEKSSRVAIGGGGRRKLAVIDARGEHVHFCLRLSHLHLQSHRRLERTRGGELQSSDDGGGRRELAHLGAEFAVVGAELAVVYAGWGARAPPPLPLLSASATSTDDSNQ